MFWGRVGWSGCRVTAALRDSTWGWRKGTGLEKDAKEKNDCNLCSAFTSDLPCMHLDPGVNRLGLNVTSIHQTDRRPVTPDIVFPICIILWPQQQNNKKKRGQYISRIHSKARKVLLDRRLRERSRRWRKSKPKPCKSKREKRFQGSRNTSGRDGGQRQEALRSDAGRPVCSEHKRCVVALFQKAAVWSCMLGVNQSTCP